MLRALTSGLLCGIVLFTPTAGLAQKKGTPPPAQAPGSPQDYANLNKQDKVQGKLVTRDPDLQAEGGKNQRHLVFRYEYEALEPNPNYKPTKPAKPHDFTREILALQQKVAAAQQMPNVQKQAVTLQQLAVQQQNLQNRINAEQVAYAQRVAAAREQDIRNNNVPYIKAKRSKDFELEIQKDVVIRRLKPAMEYDDKGFIKEYTKEELEKLNLVDNPDKKRPGYPSRYEELRPRQTIVVYLTPAKKAAAKTPPPPAPDADKDKTDKTDPEDPVIPLRPTVRMIVIVEDIPDPNSAQDPTLPPRKKKKQ